MAWERDVSKWTRRDVWCLIVMAGRGHEALAPGADVCMLGMAGRGMAGIGMAGIGMAGRGMGGLPARGTRRIGGRVACAAPSGRHWPTG